MWRRIDEARSNFSTVAFVGELAAMQIGKVSNRLIELAAFAYGNHSAVTR
jgi:hypothetical protein